MNRVIIFTIIAIKAAAACLLISVIFWIINWLISLTGICNEPALTKLLYGWLGLFLLLYANEVYLMIYKGALIKYEYQIKNGRNYFKELNDDDVIGEIQVPGKIEQYQSMLNGMTKVICSNKNEQDKLCYYLSFNYRVSDKTKDQILSKIFSYVKMATLIRGDNPFKTIDRLSRNADIIFNLYVCINRLRENR